MPPRASLTTPPAPLRSSLPVSQSASSTSSFVSPLTRSPTPLQTPPPFASRGWNPVRRRSFAEVAALPRRFMAGAQPPLAGQGPGQPPMGATRPPFLAPGLRPIAPIGQAPRQLFPPQQQLVHPRAPAQHVQPPPFRPPAYAYPPPDVLPGGQFVGQQQQQQPGFVPAVQKAATYAPGANPKPKKNKKKRAAQPAVQTPIGQGQPPQGLVGAQQAVQVPHGQGTQGSEYFQQGQYFSQYIPQQAGVSVSIPQSHGFVQQAIGVKLPAISLWNGFAAGTFPKAVCHPLDVVKKRFQEDGLNNNIPTTVHRSKADCPVPEEMVTVSVEGSVLDRIAKIMSYLRLG
ncbi:hypothetical protein ACQ4PT_013710 [Festuca glaucescens]